MRPLQRAFAFASAALAAAVIAMACGDDEEAAPLPDGRLDASDEAPADRGDSSVVDAAAPSCRTPAAPSVACSAEASACERRTLYLSPTSTYPFAVATDERHLYWVAQSGGDAAYDGTATASVLRVSKAGSPTQRAIVLARDQERATTLVRDGADLYWMTSRSFDGGSASTLRRLRDADNAAECPACGAPEDLATVDGIVRRLVRSGPAVFFAIDGSGIVRRLSRGADGKFVASQVEETSGSPSLAAGKEEVFASGGLTSRVVRVPGSSGAGSLFVTMPDAGPDAALPGAHVLGADCERVFGVRDEGAFWWSPAAPASYTPSAASFDDATDIASDEGFVYVTRRRGGGVERGRRDGTGFTTLYSGNVWRLAVDDDGIYWGEHGKGALAGNMFMQTK